MTWLTRTLFGRQVASVARKLMPYRELRRLRERNVALQRAYDMQQIQRLESLLNRHSYSLTKFRSILDFGCGRGRLLRHLLAIAPDARIMGCDIDAADIAECRKKYPRARFVHSAPKPPVDIEAEQFDFIMSFGVFTHFDEAPHRAWLAELGRLLRPDGVMLHTTHACECLRRIGMFSPEHLGKYRLACSLDDLEKIEERYHFVEDSVVYRPFGLSVISKAYVTKNWPAYSGIALLDYVEAAFETFPEGCHDAVVMHRQ